MGGSRIERMTPDGWARVKAVRLRALADTPDAFGITLAEDSAHEEAWWRARLGDARAVTFLAVQGGADVGMIVGAPFEGTTDAAGLFAMWVAPEARRRGIAEELVAAHLEWATERGFARVLLDVGDWNRAAARLYERCGFARNGVVGTLSPGREHVTEHQRERRLHALR